MDRMLYIAMNGAKQTMTAQAITANNLANVNSTGFRADLAAMISLPVSGTGFPSRVYSETENPDVDFQSGAIIPTGNELDVAISGDGWLTIQTPDGNEAYTRAGNLKVSAQGGFLTTVNGLPLIGNGGPVAVPPYEKIEIASDGTISILPVGQQPGTLAIVDRIRLVNPAKEDLFKGTDGLFRHRNNETAIADINVTLVSGALESSNVNAVASMVDMINQARSFEMQVKMMKMADENDQASARLMQLT